MGTQIETSVGDDSTTHVRVTGPLRLDTVAEVHQNLKLQSITTKSVQFDLGGVKDADSAAVALCIEWVTQAQQHNLEIRFVDMPENLKRIARVNNVESLLVTADAESATV